MKKLLSIMLTVLMVFSVLAPATMIASADTTIDDALIFSLSISEGEDGAVVLTDTAGTATATFTDCGAEAGTVGTITGKDTKYFIAGTVKNGGVYASDSEFKDAFKTDVTVEMWSKAPDTVSGYVSPLGYYGATAAYATNYNMLFQYNASTTSGQVLSYHSDKSTNVVNLSCDLTEWTHWVITRTYNAEGSNSNYGTMTVYRNGDVVNTVTLTEPMYLLDIQNYLYIGQGKKDGTASGASIGALNVYSGVMTETEVKAKHEATAEDYIEGTTGGDGEEGGEGGEDVPPVVEDPSGLVFSLDLSDAQNGNASADTIKDAATDSVDEDITVLSGSATVGTVEGKDTKYIQSINGTTNSGITIKDSAVDAAFMDEVTVEMWSKAPESLTAYRAPFSYWGAGQQYNMLFQYNSQTQGGIYTRTATGTNVATVDANVTDLADWTHWVITRTYDSSATASPYGTMTVYRNGTLVNSANISAALENDTTFKLHLGLGKSDGSAKGSGAQIGAFNVYNKILTPDEISENYDNTVADYYDIDTTGLVFNLDLSDAQAGAASASTIKDATDDLVNETIAVLTGGATVATEGNIKYIQSAAGTSGSGISIKDTAVETAFTKDVTVEMWSKAPSTVSGYVGAFAYAGTSASYQKGHNMLFQYMQSTTAGQILTKDPATTRATVNINNTDLTQWTHWVVTRTYNSSATASPYGKMIVYRNGVQVGESDISAALSILNANHYLYLGTAGITSSGAAASASGTSIATFKVYNRILDISEINKKYKAEAATYGIVVPKDIVIDGEVTYTDATGASVQELTSSLTGLKASATIKNNTSTSVPVICVLAMYDKDGNLEYYDAADVTAVDGNGTASLSFDLGTIEVAEGYYTKLLIWNRVDLTPYTNGSGLIYSSQGL